MIFRLVIDAQLHRFGDASEEAYETVSYLRLVNADGNIPCVLVIAPIQSMTIPMLEFFTTILHYIRSKAKRFHTFVANILAIIHDGSIPVQCGYVRTKMNPAIALLEG